MLHTFICLAAIACARICLIGGRPNQPPSQICRELGCPSVMATTQNLPHLLDVLRRSGVEAAAVNGWNGVYSDLVLRSNGALAPYNPQTNNANAAFCVFGYQQPVGTPVPVPCAQPLQPTYRPPTIEISSACLKPQQPHSQLTTLQPTYRPPTIEISSTCLKPQQPHSQLTTLQPTYRPPTIEIASPCHRPQPHSLPGYPNVNRCLFNMSNPSYDDRMSPDRNTHAEYSDVDEHSRYSEPSSDTNNGFYNQRPRSRSHSTNQLWPSPMPKCLPVNISASSPCGSVLPKQWQRHCYPKEHHRKPLYPLIRYNYNFNYYYVVNPFEENNHPSLCKNSYVYPYKRHRKRRKCPLIRKLEHCIRCKPHERCMGEASFCDPCQRKGFDVKICKEKEERSDERCKDRCEERSEERFDDRSDDRSSSHCRLKRERDSSERSMFEREGAIA